MMATRVRCYTHRIVAIVGVVLVCYLWLIAISGTAIETLNLDVLPNRNLPPLPAGVIPDRWDPYRHGYSVLSPNTPPAQPVLPTGTGENQEAVLQRKMVHLWERLHYAERQHQQRRKDVMALRQQFSLILRSNTGVNGTVRLSDEARHMLMNLSGGTDLQFPSIYDHMPHLLGKSDTVTPSVRISRGRTGVSIVMGIPTIKRTKESYLVQTLNSLLDNVSVEEKDDILIVVMLAENS